MCKSCRTGALCAPLELTIATRTSFDLSTLISIIFMISKLPVGRVSIPKSQKVNYIEFSLKTIRWVCLQWLKLEYMTMSPMILALRCWFNCSSYECHGMLLKFVWFQDRRRFDFATSFNLHVKVFSNLAYKVAVLNDFGIEILLVTAVNIHFTRVSTNFWKPKT